MRRLKSVLHHLTPNQWILAGILLVGTVLRFYDYFNLPFSYDEFSALFRTRFDSFGVLIEEGVKSDYHPAGVQVFLYYWISLFGDDAWVVKLPFVVAGIASIYLAYLIAKKWTNETVGLICAAMLASTQYYVMYSQYARPYASGLFFILLLVLALTRLVQQPEKRFWHNWTLFILAGTAAAYNHYFSMLFAGIVGFAGLLMVPRKLLVRYILAGLIIGLLYLPHVPILMYHMNKGGIGGPDGWLDPPTMHFFKDYPAYIFHYSIWPLITFAGIVLLGFVYRPASIPQLSKDRIRHFYLFFALFLFFTPLLIGYFYSVTKNPILQYSVLIFSHLFLYIACFGHLRLFAFRMNLAVVLIILTANILTLVQRQHYSLQYDSVYLGFLEDIDQVHEKHPNAPALLDSEWEVTAYFMEKKKLSTRFDKYTDLEDNGAFLSYLDSISRHHDFFYFGEFFYDHPRLIPQIQRYFPHIVWQHNYISGTGYLFSKHGKRTQLAEISTWTPGKRSSSHWSEIDAARIIDSAGATWYAFDSLLEFGPQFNVQLDKIMQSAANLIDVELDIDGLASGKDLLLVTQFMVGDSLMQWDGGSAKLQTINGNCTRITQSYFLGKRHLLDDGMFRATIWNLEKQSFRVKKMTLYLREGNPVKYALTHPIERATTSALAHLPLR